MDIDVTLTEAELRAVLLLIEPYVNRLGSRDPVTASAETKLDMALLAHEESQAALQSRREV